ncbi:hypothetical protein BD310DRAFT_929503 [Dichomitus squalens]|uniref:Uncharacterized protein n=1 Tax=Dichomitus squalens TaxID=114155 RepID=A0A4Q9PSF0_9APHY|nr:hypothetical protein BD310DRAFT_929503 [Dichomitus squalens]
MDISSSSIPPQGTSCRGRPASPAWKQQYVAPGDEYSAPQFSQQLAALPVVSYCPCGSRNPTG